MIYSDILASMLKVKGKPLRDYGNYLGIKEGVACVTDGYGLLLWLPNEPIGENRTINQKFETVDYTFPNWQNLTSNKGGKPVSNIHLFTAIQKSSFNFKDFKLVIDTNGLAVIRENTASNPNDNNTYFNLSCIKRYLDKLPKKAAISDSEFNDDKILLTFEMDKEYFQLLTTTNKKG